jgi:hypothetical protein
MMPEMWRPGWGNGTSSKKQAAFREDQPEKRHRIARGLLDGIADDRLLAEKTALSAAEVRGLRRVQP